VEGVVGLLRKMKNAKEGRVRDNVVPTAEARRVEELFKALGRMSWESFVQHRLPEDLKGSLGGVEGPGGGVEKRGKSSRHGPGLLGGSAEASGLPGG